MHINFVIRLLLLFIVYSSCQKKFEAPIDPVININPELKAKINGVQFNAVLSGAVRRNDGVISMAGKSNDGNFIAFTLVDSGIYKYTLDMNSSVNFCGYEDNNGLAFSSNEGINPGDSGGSLTITLIDSVKRTMSGTFNIKVFRQISRTQRIISEGIFNDISY